MSKYVWSEFFRKGKPYLGVIFLQFAFSGMNILSKEALNEGTSNYVFVVYCHVAATIVMAPFALIFERNIRPKMTCSMFIKLLILALLGVVVDHNLFFMGMKYTTATFATAMNNILPAITFVMACILRLEKVNLRSIRSQAKVVGTVTTVAGAMIMTLIKGPILELFWTNGRTSHQVAHEGVDLHNNLKGAILLTLASLTWAAFTVMQAVTLKSYPAELSMTAWICFLGTAEGAILGLIMERGNTAVWAIKWNTTVLATLYSVSLLVYVKMGGSLIYVRSWAWVCTQRTPVRFLRVSAFVLSIQGILCSGLAYYIGGLVMKDKGPVFLTAFGPLGMIIVAVMGSIILAERIYLGGAIGAIVIAAGLYLVVWGKSKDYKIESLPIGGKIPLEIQIPDEELDENSYVKVITVKVSEEVSKDGDRMTILS